MTRYYTVCRVQNPKFKKKEVFKMLVIKCTGDGQGSCKKIVQSNSENENTEE